MNSDSFRISMQNLEKIPGRPGKIHEHSHIVIEQDALKKTLRFYPCKIKLIHAMKAEDGPARKRFTHTMLQNVGQDDRCLQKICFSDEATFQVIRTVNRHNEKIWRTSYPRESVAKERNAPKVNVWCGLLRDRIIGPLFRDAELLPRNA